MLTKARRKRLAVAAQMEALMASVPKAVECPVCCQLYDPRAAHPCNDEAECRVLEGNGQPGCPECEAAAERLGTTLPDKSDGGS